MQKLIINFENKTIKGYCKGLKGFREQIENLKELSQLSENNER